MEILVAGEFYIDLVLSGFPNWPKAGEESLARDFRREVGGGAAITAVGLARLGNRVALAGIVGREDGAWVVERLASLGVDASAVEFDETEPTGVTVAVSGPMDRALFTYPGANRRLASLLRRTPPQARHVHLACPANAETLAAFGGGSVSIDIGWHAAVPEALSVLRGVDLFFPNRAEGERMTGKREPEAMLRAFERAGFRGVALKLGEDGAVLLWQGEILGAAAPNITPVDTTGAGDAFNAGFLHAWLRGGDPREWLAAGNFCGAMSTRALGGIAGLPGAEEFACRSN